MRNSISLSSPFDAFITRDPGIQRLLDQLRTWAPHAQGVLFTGEAGVGKSFAARLFHLASPHPHAPYITCSAKVGSKGPAHPWATLERGGGTVVLDLVERWTLEHQAKIAARLGAIVTQPLRLLITSRMPLARLHRETRLHASLARWYSTRCIHLPPLRARIDDIAPMLEAMLRRTSPSPIHIEPAAWRALHAHGWADNVRGLRQMVDDVLPGLSGDRLGPEHLALDRLGPPSLEALLDHGFDEMRQTVDAWYLRRLLEQTGGNISEAARRAECSRKVLRDRLRRHGLYRTAAEPVDFTVDTTASVAREHLPADAWSMAIIDGAAPLAAARAERAYVHLLEAGVLTPRRPWPRTPKARRGRRVEG